MKIPYFFIFLCIVMVGCGKSTDKGKLSPLKQCYQNEMAIIYGNNDLNPSSLAPNWLKQVSLSVAAVVNHRFLETVSKDALRLKVQGASVKLCDHSKKEISASVKCTAFLVAPDIVVTAGHCIGTDYACKSSQFIFDLDSRGTLEQQVIKKSNAYGCKELIKSQNDINGDYSIIRLERVVSNRPALRLLNVDELAYGDRVSLVGYPLTTQKTTSENGKYFRTSKDKKWLHTQVDSLSGSSGSPIIDNHSQAVVGIHTHGLKHSLIYDQKKNCYHFSKRCKNPRDCMSSRGYNLFEVPILSKYFIEPFDLSRKASGCSN